MRARSEPCDCKSTDSAWAYLCDKCRAEWQERHERAQSEKDMAELVGHYHEETK